MSISVRVAAYLDTQDIKYGILNHCHTSTSVGSAITAHIPPKTIAKAVALEDHESGFL